MGRTLPHTLYMAAIWPHRAAPENGPERCGTVMKIYVCSKKSLAYGAAVVVLAVALVVAVIRLLPI